MSTLSSSRKLNESALDWTEGLPSIPSGNAAVRGARYFADEYCPLDPPPRQWSALLKALKGYRAADIRPEVGHASGSVLPWMAKAYTIAVQYERSGTPPADRVVKMGETIRFEWDHPHAIQDFPADGLTLLWLTTLMTTGGHGVSFSTTRLQPETGAHLFTSLDKFRTLAVGWDGYVASSPSETAIDHARALVRVGITDVMLPDRVEPSAMGGVGATFTRGSREVVVEFYNSGRAHALFSDDDTDDMTTRPVRPDTAGFREFLIEVRQHLYGKQNPAPTR